MTHRTKDEVQAEVEDLAVEVLEGGAPLTIEAARAAVYEAIPELYDEYVMAQPGRPRATFEKAAPDPTLGEEIHSVVRKRAAQLAWTEWPQKTIEQIEMELWETPEGHELYELYRADIARQPMSRVDTRIAKSYTADGWDTFTKWRAG